MPLRPVAAPARTAHVPGALREQGSARNDRYTPAWTSPDAPPAGGHLPAAEPVHHRRPVRRFFAISPRRGAFEAPACHFHRRHPRCVDGRVARLPYPSEFACSRLAADLISSACRQRWCVSLGLTVDETDGLTPGSRWFYGVSVALARRCAAPSTACGACRQALFHRLSIPAAAG